MEALNHLLQTALLGTDKMPHQAQMLPEAVQIAMQRLQVTNTAAGTATPEAQLLRATALTIQYAHSGIAPSQAQTETLAAAPAPTEQICSEKYAHLISKVRTHEPQYPLLMLALLEQIGSQQQVIAPEQLVETIDWVVNTKNEEIQQALVATLGSRGRWLVALKPEWAEALQTALLPKNGLEYYISAFDSVRSERRVDWLAKLHKSKSDMALALTEHALSATKSHKERLALLKALQQNQAGTQAALSMMQEQWALLGKDEKAKANDNEIRAELAQGLLANTASELFISTAKQVATYFSRKKTMLGLSSKLQAEIPSKPDQFLNETNMVGTYGYQPLSPHKGVTDTQYWLGNLCQALHPSIWETALQTQDWKEILDFFDTLSAQNVPIEVAMHHRIARAVAHTAYAPALAALAQRKISSHISMAAVRHFTDAQLQSTIKQYPDGLTAEGVHLLWLFAHTDRPWSRAVSLDLLRLWRTSIRNFGHHGSDMAQQTGMLWHLDTIPDFEKHMQDGSEEGLVFKPHAERLLRFLKLRREIELCGG